MPYAYYQLVRLTSFLMFAFFTVKSHQAGDTNYTFLYIFLALLFQPFVKITLGRELWNAVDVIVGLGLIFSVCRRRQN